MQAEGITGTVLVQAPVAGLLMGLAEVPDPIFAAGTVGPGFAIDPISSEVKAPFDGEITQLHRCHHAVAIRHESGVEILVHVGIDTVMLRGEGFTPLVKLGDRVKAGQVLLIIDLDRVAATAPSLVTPVLLVSTPQKIVLKAVKDRVCESGQALFEVVVGATLDSSGEHGVTVRGSVRLKNPQGLHARPAAVLAARARAFSSTIQITSSHGETDARSVTGLLNLNTRWGDILEITAQGSDAKLAVEGMIATIMDGLGESTSDSAPPQEASAPSPKPATLPSANQWAGVGASPGLAIGPLYQRLPINAQLNRHGNGVELERKSLQQALNQLKQDLEGTIHNAALTAQSIQRAHLEMLSDPALLNAIDSRLLADQSAGFAVNEALNDSISKLRAMNNALLAERATDLADIRNRLLHLLDPSSANAQKAKPPTGSIWLAEELTPSEIANLRSGDVAGLISVQGGATGHVAILARSLGIPAVLGIDASLLKQDNGITVLVDGNQGIVTVKPSEDAVALAKHKIAERQQRQSTDAQSAHLPARTLDGQTIEIAANIQTLADAEQALHSGADGIGLLRSEFLFDGRTQPPTEAEQASIYASIGRVMGKDRVVVMRTLDAGGDKPLSYWPMAPEANPFLGIRGVRLSLRNPEQIDTQLRAMMAAARECRLHILFPMVGLVEEMITLSQKTRAIAADYNVDVKIGVMIEVPSAVLMADQLANLVDYFSIGTNDLTQYTLAMDRGHPALAHDADAFHPAVLKLIKMTVTAAHPKHRWVGVCGALAAEELAWPLLVGLGIDELSMPSVCIAQAKSIIRTVKRSDCEQLAEQALSQSTAHDVRQLLNDFSQRSA